MIRAACAALAAAIVHATPAAAETVILPDQGAASVGTTVTSAARVSTIRGGTLSGDNLFHSFARFDLAAGDLARWVRGQDDAASIANVVNRVTGGDPSNIDGTLRLADMPNAAFWFINPAGIVFGQGAAVDVPGAAYFSTAGELNFANGASFRALTPFGSTFSSAAPEAFGFLGAQGAITVAQADPGFTAPSGSLTLAAANIAIDGKFTSGALTLLAVGNAAASIKPGDPLPLIGTGRIGIGGVASLTDIDTGSYRLAARNIDLQNASVRAVTNDAVRGPVTIVAGDLGLNRARLAAVVKGADAGSSLSIVADRLTMIRSVVETVSEAGGNAGAVSVTANAIVGDEADISSSAAATGDAGSVLIDAGALTVDLSKILTVSNRAAIGGKIRIDADTIDVDNGIIDATNGPQGGAAGDIDIAAASLRVNNGLISSSTVNANDGGDVTIRVGELIAQGDTFINSASNEQASGHGGNLLVEADVLRVDGSDLSTSTFGAGDAGIVSVTVKALEVVGQGRISSTTSGEGNAGRIEIEADRLDFDNGYLTTGTTAGGDAGTITVNADQLSLVNNSNLSSVAEAGSLGNGGQVQLIVTDKLTLRGSQIAVSTFGRGDAGFLGVKASDILLAGGSFLASRAGLGSTGGAGPIALLADTMRLDGSGVSSSTLGAGNAGIIGLSVRDMSLSNGAFIVSQTESTLPARGGDIAIAADVLRMDSSFISASTLGAGNAGALAIITRDIGLANDSFLASQSTGSGNAGAVLVQADILRSDASELTSAAFSTGNAGTVEVIVRDLALTGGASINTTATAGSSGKAGDLTVRSDILSLDGSKIDSSTFGSGNGGVVKVRAASLTAINDSTISSAAGEGSAGKGGDTIVNADKLALDSSIITSSTFGSGDAGIAAIVGKELVLTNFSRIETQAKEGSSGNAGGVGVDADIVRLDSSEINSNTFGPGDAGGVVVTADRLELRNQSFVSSQASSGRTGDAGAVQLDVGALDVAASQIDSATLGTGNAGVVAITANQVILRPGAFVASQTEAGSTGSGGSVFIDTGTLSASGAIVSSSTQGTGDGGSVEITAGDVELLNGTRVVSLATSTATGRAGQVTLSANNLTIDGATISSATSGPGDAGTVTLAANRITAQAGASVATSSDGAGDAGDIVLTADLLTVDGSSSINSSSSASGDAGSIDIGAEVINLIEGANITTNSAFGPAGDITLRLPQNGVLQLIGETPAVITTTSGPSTGGRITITDPYLILSHGGSILALGDQSGANVQISSDFFIRSADRLNLLSVNGSLVLDSQISDLSAGTEAPDVDFLDASSVLSGQCAAARSTGRTSRFTSRITGPYAPIAPAVPLRALPESAPPITFDARRLLPCG